MNGTRKKTFCYWSSGENHPGSSWEEGFVHAMLLWDKTLHSHEHWDRNVMREGELFPRTLGSSCCVGGGTVPTNVWYPISVPTNVWYHV